jgi:hypothetical protein
MALPNVDPSLPSNIAPLFSDSDAARGDHMRANNAAIWGNLEYLLDGPVNGISASATAEANKLLALDANAKLPASITGDAASCSGNAATATRLNLQQLNVAQPFYIITTIGGVYAVSSIVQNMPRDNEYWTLILTGSTAAGTSGALQYTAISSNNPGEIWTQMLVNGVFAGWKMITTAAGRAYSVTGDNYLSGTYTLGQVVTAIITKYGNSSFSARVSGRYGDQNIYRVAWESDNVIRYWFFDNGSSSASSGTIATSNGSSTSISIHF